MEFTWTIRDRYGGKHRPQTTEVSEDEIRECDSVDEAVRLVTDAIRDDYEKQIAPEWDESEIRQAIEKVMRNAFIRKRKE